MQVLGWIWGYEKSHLANNLDEVHLLLKITDAGLLQIMIYWQGALDAMEEVPTSSFHWWVTYMGMSFIFYW